MPELPEVETVRAALDPILTDAVIETATIRRPDLRWPLPPDLARIMTNAPVLSVQRRAKILVLELPSHMIMWHLGMSGSMRIQTHAPNLLPHDHISLTILRQTDSQPLYHYVTYNDPRRFGYVDLVAKDDFHNHRSISSLGPEPLSDECNLAYFDEMLASSSAPIKSTLLDQKKIAGLGNIYVCEALFRAGISPRRSASSVVGKRSARLLPAIKQVLQEAIAQGGTSLRDHRQPDGKLGYFVQSLNVYGKEGAPCPSCQTQIKSVRMSGRSSFYCPSCQR